MAHGFPRKHQIFLKRIYMSHNHQRHPPTLYHHGLRVFNVILHVKWNVKTRYFRILLNIIAYRFLIQTTPCYLTLICGSKSWATDFVSKTLPKFWSSADDIWKPPLIFEQQGNDERAFNNSIKCEATNAGWMLSQRLNNNHKSRRAKYKNLTDTRKPHIQ